MKKERKMYYCIAGAREIIVPEEYITKMEGFVISATKAYYVSAVPTMTPGAVSIRVSEAVNVHLNCNVISDLLEKDVLYDKILSVMTGIDIVSSR